MDRDVQEIRLRQWEKLVQDASACGKTKKEWCSANGVSTRQFYYWQRKVRRNAIEKLHADSGQELPVFAALNPPAESSFHPKSSDHCQNQHNPDAPGLSTVILCSGDYRVLIGNSVSENVLIKVLRAMKNA